jgi:large subunit ribosomal protein L10
MAITKQKKQEIVSKIENLLGNSNSVVFVNFDKLTVADASEVRRSLKKENVGYTVLKKTLIKKVLNESKVKGDMPSLSGEIALAYGEDLLAPAREVFSFQKKLGEKVNIVGGIYEGVYKSKEEMVSIASIPSLQVLRGMFVNIINSPIQRYAIALNQIAEKK